MDRKTVLSMNTTALAFLGDAVYEVRVREHLLKNGGHHADRLHRDAVDFVRAKAQAGIIKKMAGMLTEEELALAKRARNRKSATKPKNADPVDYKWATAFEALIGYLYLAGEYDRLEEIIKEAIRAIETERCAAVVTKGDQYGEEAGEK